MVSLGRSRAVGFFTAAGLVGLASMLARAGERALSSADIVMIYLLAVVISAYQLGRGPSVFGAALSVVAYNFFFISPRHTLAVDDLRDLVTFATLFAVGIVVSTLADRLRREEAAGLRRRADEIRAALLSSVSHDLRTPLATITGAATAILDHGDKLADVDKAELLASIRDEAARMERLVGNLLEMSRLSAGPIALRREMVPVEELVGDALGRIEPQLGARVVATPSHVGELLVEGDPVLLAQLLFNLLENAARHTPDGTSIEIEAGSSAEGVRISVVDSGPGLPAGDTENLFHPFVRGAGARGAGTGLGLAICRGIARAHGGELWAERAHNGGAAFTLLLPRRQLRAGGAS